MCCGWIAWKHNLLFYSGPPGVLQYDGLLYRNKPPQGPAHPHSVQDRAEKNEQGTASVYMVTFALRLFCIN